MTPKHDIRQTADPRRLAVDILNRVEERNAYAEPLLDHSLSRRLHHDPRGRRLVTQIVLGTLRQRGYLDWVIARFYRGPFDAMATGLKNTLRAALYQIFFMDRLPAHAVVNASVGIAESCFRGRGALVNALLRRSIRERNDIHLPDRNRDAALYLSVACSHPRWLVEKWIALFGEEETERLCLANNMIPPVTVRVNSLKTTRHALLEEMNGRDWEAEAAVYARDAILMKRPACPVRETSWFREGKIQLQDEGSQLVSLFTDPHPEETILDLCAGTGGKTTHLAALIRDRGSITALDVAAAKLDSLRQMSERLGATCIRTLCRDGRTAPPDSCRETFDLVLVDAPCTGLGTLRRNPEIKWRLSPKDILQTLPLQRDLLDGAAAYLRTGGLLIYSTCSVLPEENEEQASAFLTRHREFRPETSPDGILPECLDEKSFLKMQPHRHGTDGFFAVRFRKILPAPGVP